MSDMLAHFTVPIEMHCAQRALAMEELHKWQESFGSLEASDAARVAELANVKVKSAEAETRLLSLVCSASDRHRV